ncbi:helix-turn-helix domain-containing protein [Microvenator marinus]|uniref:Helix-turn-helix domain-containing protein n=1 Tax=Microvenator marinus TaxID=2600177 RepID=A0A5B8XRW2_9DELT|nr:helix-turn-helix domain-containing protein [Microvenator marinus]QED28255.1 helix-turn-helix domain-containing protein [Microvenator marinus]
MEDKMMTIEEVAKMTALDPKILSRYRTTGEGPEFIRLGHRTIRYWRSDVVNWLNANRYRSTSQYEVEEA